MDWIAARRKCSIEHAWNVLCERVRADIDTWAASTEDSAGLKIEISVDADTAVITKNSPRMSTSKITLRRKAHRIIVGMPTKGQNRGTSMMLTPLVTEAGECRMRIGGSDMEFWQASRQILESFLFGDDA